MSNEKFGIRHPDGEVSGRYDSWLEAYYAIPLDDEGYEIRAGRVVRLSEESGS